MKNNLGFLYSYIKLKFKSFLMILIIAGFFFIVCLLYSLPLEPIYYASLLSGIFLLLSAIPDFLLFRKNYNMIMEFKSCRETDGFIFPEIKNPIHKEYEEIIKKITRDKLAAINEKDKTLTDMTDYYTIWVHQIKTPISAMRLLLQTEKSDAAGELLEQLFRVEEYVGMVLQYLRAENISSDLHIQRYALDPIIKQAVRKYSKLFIRKKIKLNYKDLNDTVLTDEKWLVFVLEQILSNSLKYTNKGEISIYMDEKKEDTLVIEDTGIGIEAEDIPRIFEKGFTGFNGRSNKKSTGIGLFLCKRILNKLSHKISIESEIDKGTRIKIELKTVELNFND